MVQGKGEDEPQRFRDAVAGDEKAYVFETIHHQEGKDRTGEGLPQVLDHRGVGFLEENSKKGRNLGSMVPATHRAIVSTCW